MRASVNIAIISIGLVLSFSAFSPAAVRAQSAQAPSSDAEPAPAEPAPAEPAPAEPAPEEPVPEQPAAEPQPEPAPPPPQPSEPPPPQYQEQPQDGYQGEPPEGRSYRETYGLQGDESYQQEYREREPSGRDRDGGGGGSFSMPPIGVRLDPFNWLIEGRLGLELEVGLWKFISFELVPVFSVNSTPPSLNLSGREDNLSQHSNGLGPISGTSLGFGFWLSGKPLKGYVIRAIFTNYGYRYKTTDSTWGTIDTLKFTERRIYGFFGSHSNWGPVTLAGGIGLGYELNQQQRCFAADANGRVDIRDLSTSGCPDDGEQHIALSVASDDPYEVTGGVGDINGWLHPVYVMARFSLGIALDFD